MTTRRLDGQRGLARGAAVGAEAVLAGALGFVQRVVGDADQVDDVLGVVRIQADADAGRQLQGEVVDEEGLGQRLDQLGGRPLGVAQAVHVAQQHDEFVAAQARHGVFLARIRQQALRHHLEDLVAVGVAVGVVDRLEAVQVEVHDRGLVVVAVGVLQGVFDAVFEQAAVRQAGEGVVQRQFLLGAAVLGQFLVQQAYFQHVVDALVHFEQVEGLADEVARAGFERGDLEAGLGREGQHRQVAALFDFLQALHDLETVQARHLQVEQDQVVVVFAMQGHTCSGSIVELTSV
jgi:hypothetical protein